MVEFFKHLLEVIMKFFFNFQSHLENKSNCKLFIAYKFIRITIFMKFCSIIVKNPSNFCYALFLIKVEFQKISIFFYLHQYFIITFSTINYDNLIKLLNFTVLETIFFNFSYQKSCKTAKYMTKNFSST